MAQRAETEGSTIRHQGIQVERISASGEFGDRFATKNNASGVEQRREPNADLRLSRAWRSVQKETEPFSRDTCTPLNRAGTLLGQAQVAQQALEIVRDQAVSARESVAGVNLDAEAASLIKFQQAYRASARLIQTANQLFDTIVRM